MSHVPFLDALRLQTRQTDPLLSVTLASVPTSKCFIATILHKFDTLWPSAHILKSRIIANRGLLELLLTESATQCLLLLMVLFARVIDVIGRGLAPYAKVLFAAGASDSILRHMLSMLFAQRLSIIILCRVIYSLCRFKLKHGVAAWTFNNLRT